jgi:hypothetical protein
MSEPQFFDQSEIPLLVSGLEIFKEFFSLIYQPKQSPPGMMILFMFFKMFGQAVYPFREKSNLNLR